MIQRRSQEVARARGRADVAVTRDCLGGHLLARPVQRGRPLPRARACRGEDGRSERVDVVDLELPGDEVADGVEDLLLRRGVRVQRVSIAEEGHREGLSVEAGRVGPHDRPIDTACTALVEASEPIDHEVVAEVVDLNPLGEPGINVAHLLCRLRGGVVVRGHDVVHEGHLDRVGVRRLPATQRLVGAPLRATDDRGLAHGGLRRR